MPKEAAISGAKHKFDSQHPATDQDQVKWNCTVSSVPKIIPETVSFARLSVDNYSHVQHKSDGKSKVVPFLKGKTKMPDRGLDRLSHSNSLVKDRKPLQEPREPTIPRATGSPSKVQGPAPVERKRLAEAVVIGGETLPILPAAVALVGKKRLGMGRPVTPYQPPSKRSKS